MAKDTSDHDEKIPDWCVTGGRPTIAGRCGINGASPVCDSCRGYAAQKTQDEAQNEAQDDGETPDDDAPDDDAPEEKTGATSEGVSRGEAAHGETAPDA